jgi:hypothetical protein
MFQISNVLILLYSGSTSQLLRSQEKPNIIFLIADG